MDPYYSDDLVTLYHGDIAEVLPTLGTFSACIADPPFGTTNLDWDQWPQGWPSLVAEHTSTLWCFGTARMFFDRLHDFATWRFGQDIVWRKNTATSMQLDRFRRQHEQVMHFYRGAWPDQRRVLPKVAATRTSSSKRRDAGVLISDEKSGDRVFDNHFKPMDTPWVDEGTRYVTSVIDVPKAPHRGRINATQKPVGIIEPLIAYSCPVDGVVLDPFAGSGSTAIAARNLGRRSVLIETREEQCESAALRLSQQEGLFGALVPASPEGGEQRG